MRVGIGDGQKTVRLGQANRVDLGSGGFQKGQAIFEFISLFQRKGGSSQMLNPLHGNGTDSTARLKETEQRCRARHEGWPDAHAVCKVEEPALKTSVIGEGLVEEQTPAGVGEVPVHGIARCLVERTADAMTLY